MLIKNTHIQVYFRLKHVERVFISQTAQILTADIFTPDSIWNSRPSFQVFQEVPDSNPGMVAVFFSLLRCSIETLLGVKHKLKTPQTPQYKEIAGRPRLGCSANYIYFFIIQDSITLGRIFFS